MTPGDPPASQASEAVDGSAHTMLGSQLNTLGPDPGEHEEAVESLLASASRSDSFGQLFEGAGKIKRLSHYLLLERVGAGGMGVVYAAFDEKLERKVAIKLLRSPDQEAQRRLVREAQSMARISHPNVVQIYEISERAGAVFIVMEFIAGQTLRAWLQQRPRSQAEILATFQAAGRGLMAAHSRGLVHRDFKPDNVMLHRDGRVLVMDFGLAYQTSMERSRVSEIRAPLRESSVLGQTASTTFERTAAGALMGTPAYMAPEQFNGLDTDARTDQYAFCVALWEALHGERPFKARNLAALADVVTRGQRAPFEGTEVPPWLRKIIDRGLALEPSARWPSMGALIEALGRDPTRRRRGYALAAGGLALLAAGVGGWQLSVARARAQTLDACASEARRIDELWNSDTRERLAASFAATTLELAPATWSHAETWLSDYATAWSQARAQVCREARVERVRSRPAEQAVATCLDERRAAFEGLLLAWEQPDAPTVARAASAATELPPIATCLSERSLALRVDAPSELATAVGEVRLTLERAAALEYAGNYAGGLETSEAALSAAKQLEWAPLEAEALLSLGRAQARLDQLEQAELSLRQAQLRALAAGHDLVALDTATWLTSVARMRHTPEQALAWAELGEALVVRLGLEDSLQEAALLTNLGVTLRGMGELERALEAQRLALTIREAVLGTRHPAVANTLNNIGVIHWSLGEFDAALAKHEGALGIAEAAFGTEHRLVLSAQSNIANVYMAQGELERALASHREVLRIKQSLFGADHSTCASAHNNVGVVLRELGKAGEAVEHFEAAIEIWSARLGERHARVAIARVGLGQTLHALEVRERARYELELAAEIQREAKVGALDMAETQFALARLDWDEGAQAGARELARAAALAYAEAGAASERELAAVETWLQEHPLPAASAPQ